ncbi:MAG: hypothetical protein RL563_1288 [Pseudomonadota bacterium]|jgi:DNA-binding Lrp family transcriptional regulator
MIDAIDFQLIAAVQSGLPVVARPYAEIAERVGLSESEVIARLLQLKSHGLIKRWGVVVKHRELGFSANAMIVMDVPDECVGEIGALISQQACVNLCYQRPRQGEIWPYNLYCMIHGKNRETVLAQWAELQSLCGLGGFAYEVLFSRRCFKQRGALYARRLSSSDAFDNVSVVSFSHAIASTLSSL